MRRANVLLGLIEIRAEEIVQFHEGMLWLEYIYNVEYN